MTFFHFGLTGYPLGHSLSPRLQAAALKAAGLEGEYRLYPVLPLPDGQAELQALVSRLRKRELHGLNVTIPHKSAILPLLDELTPIASAAGAVNTIYGIGDRLVGDNTDVGGFSADLERCLTRAGRNFPVAGSQQFAALVLGAGGSARAVVYVLARAGYQVWIAARRSEQAQELAVSIENGLQTRSTVSTAVRWQRASLTESSASIQGIPLTPVALRQLPERVALIVNTTPLGMAPHSGVSAWPDEIPLPPDACVYDLVYNPPETPLIHLARKSGLPVCGGLGMLVEQAALAFERWTGQPASRSDMLAAVAELQLLENSS